MLPSNPLDYHVQQIVIAPQYLTVAHVEKLAPLIKVVVPDAFPAPEPIDTTNMSLKAQIARQLRMLQKLESLSVSSTDIQEVKKVMDASRDLFNLLNKFNSAVAAEERTDAIFLSIRDALTSFNDSDLTDRFMEHYKKRIAVVEAKQAA